MIYYRAPFVEQYWALTALFLQATGRQLIMPELFATVVEPQQDVFSMRKMQLKHGTSGHVRTRAGINQKLLSS